MTFSQCLYSMLLCVYDQLCVLNNLTLTVQYRRCEVSNNNSNFKTRQCVNEQKQQFITEQIK